MAERVAQLKNEGVAHWVEGAKFLEHIQQSGGRIDIYDERLLAAPCRPVYEHWEAVKRFVLQLR